MVDFGEGIPVRKDRMGEMEETKLAFLKKAPWFGGRINFKQRSKLNWRHELKLVQKGLPCLLRLKI